MRFIQRVELRRAGRAENQHKIKKKVDNGSEARMATPIASLADLYFNSFVQIEKTLRVPVLWMYGSNSRSATSPPIPAAHAQAHRTRLLLFSSLSSCSPHPYPFQAHVAHLTRI